MAKPAASVVSAASTALARLVESAVIGFYNGRRERREAAAPEVDAAEAPIPAADPRVEIGNDLPWRPAPGNGPFVDRSRPAAGQCAASVSLPLSARRKHLYAIGATGSGKTNFLMRLIEDDLGRDQSLCVIDLRGDLVDRVLLRVAARPGAAETLARRVLLLDLRETGWSVGFNPLGGDGDAYARAFHVLSVLKHSAESWGVQLDETLRNCLLALAETGGSLLELAPLLSEDACRRQTLARVTDPYVRAFFAGYDGLSPEKQLQWRLPVLNKVSGFLAIPAVRRMLSDTDPTYALRDFLDRTPGAVILVSLAVDRLQGAAHLVGGLFVSAFQNAVLARVDIPEEKRAPVHLYVDEFENLVSHDTSRFEQMLAEGRRFGLGLTLSHQNLSQMPTGMGQMILANANTQLYFQTGAGDAAQLAREIVPHPGESAETVRQTLMTQPVGTAFVLRRGQASPTERVQVHRCPDPPVPPERVAAVRRAALGRYGRPAAAVDAAVAARLAPGGGSSRRAGTEPEPAPFGEVIHTKIPGRFAPARPSGRKPGKTAAGEGDNPGG